MPHRRALWFTFFTVALWAGVFPAVLIGDAGSGSVPLRAWPLVALGLALLVGGTALILYPGEELAERGVRLFGVTPGPVLVTDGWHGSIRNPMDVGVVLVAVASWAAFDVDLMWVVPAAALVYYVGGIGPYEDRRLLELFGEDFKEYKRSVPKWVPGGF